MSIGSCVKCCKKRLFFKKYFLTLTEKSVILNEIKKIGYGKELFR